MRRDQRRVREVNAAVVAPSLAGGNSRRLRGGAGAVAQGGAPLEEGRLPGRGHAQGRAGGLAHPLAGRVDVFGLYLDAIALRVCSAGKVVSAPVLSVVAILTDGQKQLMALELCGGESFDACKGVLKRSRRPGCWVPQ